MSRSVTATRRDHRSRLVALALLVVLALVAVGCSDAHSDLERQLSDTGTDPDMNTIYTPSELTPLLRELSDTFGRSNPGFRFYFVTDSSGGLMKKFNNHGAVSMWFDQKKTIDTVLGDPRVAAPAQPLGADLFQFFVATGNPKGISGLDVFGSAHGSTISGMCYKTVLCGQVALKVLEKAGVTPSNVQGAADGETLVDRVADGRYDAGLAYHTAVSQRKDALTVLPLPQPTFGSVTYSFVQLSANPKVAAFASWVSTSAEARAIITAQGLDTSATGVS